MIEYVKNDIQKGLMLIKQIDQKECDICHYWYFKDIGFKYEPYLCNGCHDLIQKAIILLLYMLKKMLTEFIFWYMSNDDAINIVTGSNLFDKRGVL